MKIIILEIVLFLVTIHLPPDTTWVKINTQECNYLRVLYSLYDWKLLANVLQTNMTVGCKQLTTKIKLHTCDPLNHFKFD